MNTRTLPFGISSNLFEIQLSPLPFFTKDFSIDTYSFKLTSLSYYGGRTYLTILLDNKHLCVNSLARLGVDLVYAPILTLDNEKHVFYLDAPRDITVPITYHLFGSTVNLFYVRKPYYDSDKD